MTKYDSVVQIISGTFVLKPKSHNITNGRFDVKYEYGDVFAFSAASLPEGEMLERQSG